jgi:hypothetical protein
MCCGIRRYGLKAMVLLFAFALGVSLTRIVRYTHYIHCPSGVAATHERLDYASLQTVNICDLKAAPELYEGKVLLLDLKPYRSGMVRADELCIKGDPRFHLEFAARIPSEADTKAILHGGGFTLAGRFSKSPAAGDWYTYQFQVFRIVAPRTSVSQ